MLRALPTRPEGPDHPYPVPWRLDRDPPHYDLVNRSAEIVSGITLTLFGSGRLIWGLPGRLGPGEGLRFAVHGDELERNGVVVVRWRRENGDEYLWRISF